MTIRPLKYYLFIFFAFFCFNTNAALKKDCQDKKLTIYTKEFCIHCVNMKKLLNKNRLKYQEIELTEKHILYSWLYSSTKQRTVPFVYINDRFVGGLSDFKKLCLLE